MANRRQLKGDDVFLAFARYSKESGTDLQIKFMQAATGMKYQATWAHYARAKKAMEAEDSDATAAPAPTADVKKGGGKKRKADGDAAANGGEPKRAKKGEETSNDAEKNSVEAVVKQEELQEGGDS